MRSIRMSALAAAFVIAAGAIGAASAQDQRSGPPGGPMMGSWSPRDMGYGFMGPGMMGYGAMGPWMMGWSGSPAAICNAMVGHVEGRLAYLKTELKITNAQEALWNSYAAAARDNANAMLAHCNAMMSQRGASSATLPDRLDQHVQLMEAQLDAVRAMNKALRPLYAVLSDSQKRTVDQLYWGPMGMI